MSSNFDWLWQQAAWDWILVPLGGIILGLLRKWKPNQAGVAAYALAGSAFVAIIMFVLVGRPIFSSQRPQTTTENVETNVKAWADKFSLGLQSQKDEHYYFAVLITLRSGRTVIVGRAKDREQYLQFESSVTLSPELQAIVMKLPPAQLERVRDEVNIELARSRIGFQIPPASPLRTIQIGKSIPIGPSFNETNFTDALDEMDSALLLASEAVKLALYHNGVMPHSANAQ